MVHDRFNITIIGAGVIGLAVAEELSRRYDGVLVLEKNEKFGQETSSRHSGVIHAGIYYPADSLKARFCVEGNPILYEICAERDIPHQKTGKLIVAVSDNEEAELLRLKAQAEGNGVDTLSLLSRRQLQTLEPEVQARAALFSPSTGIIDAHGLMRSFCVSAESRGATVVCRSEVTAIERDGPWWEITLNGGEYRFQSRIVINCAGLLSDGIAALAGIDPDREGYRLKYCKGDYFSLSPAPVLRHLVYPVPQEDIVGLGIHTTLDLGGRVRLGPDTEYVEAVDYRVDEDKQRDFYRAVSRYLPGINEEYLHPDTSGIRPKLQGPGEPVRDYLIREESSRGHAGLINLIGMESPGLTACVPIARHVATLVAPLLD